jgi:hypothetical protein
LRWIWYRDAVGPVEDARPFLTNALIQSSWSVLLLLKQELSSASRLWYPFTTKQNVTEQKNVNFVPEITIAFYRIF